jgi:hypothetical protein
MKIRKKAPKPSPSKPPLYLVGYRYSAPSLDELKIWYDFEYGGPLMSIVGEAGQSSALSHGPWHARLLVKVDEANAARWRDVLNWDHDALAVVSPAGTSPASALDTVLFSARLARGMTLLSQGTAFDVIAQQYLNPSDWSDRPLTLFHAQDHVMVHHTEAEDPAFEWFYTLGLGKFGLDEMELIRPRGLPSLEAVQLLTETADQVLRSGQNQKIGNLLDLPTLAQTVRFIKHRTAAPTGRTIAFRQISL